MAQSNNLAATVTKASGPIVVERGGQNIELKEGDSVFATDTIKTQAASAELTFTDGATAILSPHTVMTVQEFAFETGEPSFVLDLAQGAMRSISGQVVEQNPDAFKVVTPKATVGIRGTDFAVILNADSSEDVILFHLDQGHNLVVTTYTGELSSLTTADQGVHIGADADSKITPHTYNQEEIDDILSKIHGELEVSDAAKLEEEKRLLEEEKSKAEEENSDGNDNSSTSDTNQVQVLLDQSLLSSLEAPATSLLGGANEDNLDSSLSGGPAGLGELGEDDELLLELEEESEDDDDAPSTTPNANDLDLDLDAEDDLENTDLPLLTTDGISDFYGDMQDITGGTHSLGSQRIELSADMNTNVTISGDAMNVSGGANVTGGNDQIIGQNMAAGSVVGDASSVDGSTLVGGNDEIVFNNKTGGNSIYGDAKFVTNAVETHFGDDKITLNGDFTASILSGDVNTYGGQAGAVVTFGDDVITVNGDVSGTAAIYGDDVSGASDTDGGNDTIIVTGTFSGTIEAGGGADSVDIGTIAGGTIDLGANDGASDSLNFDNISPGASVTIENFEAGSDKLYINNQEQTVTGNGNYGGLDITFTTPSGTFAPTITANNLDVTEDTAVVGNDISDTDTVATNAAAGSTYGLSAPDASGNMQSSVTLAYGTLNIDAAGNYTYTADNTQIIIQRLGAGETLTENATIYVRNPQGIWNKQDITITINGIDDTHSVTTTLTDSDVSEAGFNNSGQAVGDAKASGTISISDIDTNDVHSLNVGGVDVTTGTTYYVVSGAGGYTLTTTQPVVDAYYGTITFGGSGKNFSYDFTLNDNKATINALDNGGSINLNLGVSAKNQDNVTTNSNDINITINGSNDAPTVSVSIGGFPTLSETGVDNTRGTITVVDPESSDLTSQTVVFTINNTDYTINTAVGAGATTINGTYGKFVVNADGTYTYTLYTAADGALYDALGALESSSVRAESFTVTTTDAGGLSDTSNQVDITIWGSNSVPTVVIPNNAHTTYDKDDGALSGDGDARVESGTFTADNMIDGGGGTVSITYTDATGALRTATIFDTNNAFSPITLTTQYGNLNITGYDVATGQFTYNYEQTGPANHGAGALTDEFDITVADKDSNTTAQDTATGNITVTLVDDVPVANDDSITTSEGAAAPTTGNLLANDESGGDGWLQNAAGTATAAVTDVVVKSGGGETWTRTANADGSFTLTSSLGTLVVKANGEYTFTVDANHLGAGEQRIPSFTYTVQDGDGDTDTADVTVTIAGTADTPTITIVDGALETSDAALASGGGTSEDGSAASTSSSGSFTFTAPDGMEGGTIEIGTATLVFDASGNITIPAGGINASGTYGSLIINSVSGPVGGVYTVDYTYFQTTEYSHGADGSATDKEDVAERYDVKITDGHGTSGSLNDAIEVTINDDAPVVTSANNDLGSIDSSIPTVQQQASSYFRQGADVAGGEYTVTGFISSAAHGSLANTTVYTFAWGLVTMNNLTGTYTVTATNNFSFDVQYEDGDGDIASAAVNGTVVNKNITYPTTAYDVADTINSSDVQQDDVLVGDDVSKGGTGDTAGGDTINITGNVQDNGIVVGDVYVDNTGNTPLKGGSDGITIDGNLQGTAIVYGDSAASNYENADGGGDSIIITGSMQENSIIYADNYSSNPETNTAGGADHIEIQGNMDGGTIYAGGNSDNIIISQNMTGGTIYGGAGADEITIGDTINGNSAIYGGADDDAIRVGIKMDGGTIDGGDGNDNITLNEFVRGNVLTGAGDDKVFIATAIDQNVTLNNSDGDDEIFITNGINGGTLNLAGNGTFAVYSEMAPPGSGGSHDAFIMDNGTLNGNHQSNEFFVSGMYNNSTINAAEGADTITITTSIIGGSIIDFGADIDADTLNLNTSNGAIEVILKNFDISNGDSVNITVDGTNYTDISGDVQIAKDANTPYNDNGITIYFA